MEQTSRHLFVTNLDVMLREFFSKRSTTHSERIDGIVDRNLAVLMVEPGIDVFTTLLEDFLAKHD